MSLRECADDYDRLVAILNDDWRVIECRDGIQWILQRRGSPKRSRRDDWRGRSYCRTADALIRCTRDHVGDIDPVAAAVLVGLPARIELGGAQQKQSRCTKVFAESEDRQ